MIKQTIKKIKSKKQNGFTLIEILVVIGLVAILAAVVVIAINPARQFAQGRNSQRTSNVSSIVNAIGQNSIDNKGIFTCAAGVIPTVATNISKTGYDLRPCIAPTYIGEIPIDPATGSNTCTDASCSLPGTYNTGYTVQRDSVTQRIKVCAPSAAEAAIPGSVAICIER